MKLAGHGKWMVGAHPGSQLVIEVQQQLTQVQTSQCYLIFHGVEESQEGLPLDH